MLVPGLVLIVAGLIAAYFGVGLRRGTYRPTDFILFPRYSVRLLISWQFPWGPSRDYEKLADPSIWYPVSRQCSTLYIAMGVASVLIGSVWVIVDAFTDLSPRPFFLLALIVILMNNGILYRAHRLTNEIFWSLDQRQQ